MADRFREVATMTDAQVQREAVLRHLDVTGKTVEEIREELVQQGSIDVNSWAVGNFAAAAAVIAAAGFLETAWAIGLILFGLAMLAIDIWKSYDANKAVGNDWRKMLKDSVAEILGIIVIFVGFVTGEPYTLIIAVIVLVYDGAKEMRWV